MSYNKNMFLVNTRNNNILENIGNLIQKSIIQKYILIKNL